MKMKKYNSNKRTSLKTKRTAKYRITESNLKEGICNFVLCKNNKNKLSGGHIGGAGSKFKLKK